MARLMPGSVVRLHTLLTSLLVAFLATAQQIPGFTFPHELLGLSAPCFAAVNRTVASCPAWLPGHAGLNRASFTILADTELQTLCDSSCRNDLTGLRSTISASCTGSEDVMVPGGIAYPPTLLVDRFLFAASLSCLKESATGLYCDSVVSTWPNDTSQWTSAQRCHECQLEIGKQQLASPFGYAAEAASEFASTTSSCGANQYTYPTPTSYALNSTTGAPPRPTCAGTRYVVKANDSCNSIAEAKSVATEALISLNGIDLACNTMPRVGTPICLPKTCTIHELAMLDTCASIVAAYNITMGQLLAWNPVISSGCMNLNSWRGRYLCVSAPGGTITLPDGSKATTAAPIPTNTQGGSRSPCGQWFTISSGDTCASVSLAFSIALSDFYFLNPQVDSSCSNLWLGYAYCVRAVGDITTYSGYPVTTPATTFTRPPEVVETYPPIPWADPMPRAAGTRSDCFFYDDAWPAEILATDPTRNACRNWAILGGVTVELLIEWNPSLNAANCELQSGNSYCIQKDDETISATDDGSSTTSSSSATSTTSSPTTTSATTTTGSPPPPAPTQPGADPSCKKWHVVVSGDGCWAISNQYGINLSDFYKWNPGVGSECQYLWLDYAVCVGV